MQFESNESYTATWFKRIATETASLSDGPHGHREMDWVSMGDQHTVYNDITPLPPLPNALSQTKTKIRDHAHCVIEQRAFLETRSLRAASRQLSRRVRPTKSGHVAIDWVGGETITLVYSALWCYFSLNERYFRKLWSFV